MIRVIRRHLPQPIKDKYQWSRYVLEIVRKLPGQHPKTCSACGYNGLFRAFAHPPQYDGICPACGSLKRHRLFALALQRNPLVNSSDEVIHFAPEPVIARILQNASKSYRSADINPIHADLILNIEAIELQSNSIDVVVCNHVLEHVNDRAALGEIFRILRPGGRLLAMIPLIEGWDMTYEDATITTPDERELHFGQNDHVRYYGRDFRARVLEAGFDLSEFVASGLDVVTYALNRGERVFIGTKSIAQ